MKNTTEFNSMMNSCNVNELSYKQQIAFAGGGFFREVGWAIGYASGYFLATGDRIALEAIAIVRFGFLR